jgi:hypothetical protein
LNNRYRQQIQFLFAGYLPYFPAMKLSIAGYCQINAEVSANTIRMFIGSSPYIGLFKFIETNFQLRCVFINIFRGSMGEFL